MRKTIGKFSLGKLPLLLFALATIISMQLLASPKVHAAYDGGQLIDNAIFLDAQSLSATDIQTFLVSKGAGLANLSFVLNCDQAGNQAKQIYLSLDAPCGQSAPASHIIYYAAQVYGISPKVILATMQKEQSLATAANPTSWQLSQAMGYACPTSGNCSDSSNFFWQIDNGTWVMRFHYERARGNMNWWYTSTSWTCGTQKAYYQPNLYPNQNVNFYDQNGVNYRTHFIATAATSSLYCYTPHAYNNPQGLYGLPAYGTTGMYYTGSYNFVKFFELWFGTTQAFVFEGVNYNNVFDPDYYLVNNPDVEQVYGDNPFEAFRHFRDHGMKEGRKGNEDFDVISYKNRHQDLRMSFRNNLPAYYKHYTTYGKNEGRIATGAFSLVPITSYGGKSYSSVYDYSKYLEYNADIRQLFANDDAGAIEHFVMYGMGEARVASPLFDVTSYRGHYYDLRRVLGGDTKLYYYHFIYYGQAEGRSGTGNFVGGTSTFNGVNYSSLYQFNHYRTVNSDIRTAFGLDDISALQHFINFGMKEGRQASTSFSASIYKARYPDLQAAFGNNTEAYYLHYLYYGQAEGRSAE